MTRTCGNLPDYTSLGAENGAPLLSDSRDASPKGHPGRKTGLCFFFFNRRKCLSGAGCRYSHCVGELKPLKPLPAKRPASTDGSDGGESEKAGEVSTTNDSSSLHSGRSQDGDDKCEGNSMPNREQSGASGMSMPRRQVSWDPSTLCCETMNSLPCTSAMPSRQVSSGTEVTYMPSRQVSSEASTSSLPSRQVTSGTEASCCIKDVDAYYKERETLTVGSWARREETSVPSTQRPPQRSTERTLLVMGVPKTLRQSAVAAELLAQDQSILGAFDFLWCPWEAAKRCRNVGYFVINFPDSRDADAFQARWSGRVFSEHGSPTRQLFVKPATLQGKSRNLEYCHLKRGQCLTGDHLALTFEAAEAAELQQQQQQQQQESCEFTLGQCLPGNIPASTFEALAALQQLQQQQQQQDLLCPSGAMRFKEDMPAPTYTGEPDDAPLLSRGTLESPTEDVRATLLMSRRDEASLGNGQLVLAWLLIGGIDTVPSGVADGRTAVAAC